MNENGPYFRLKMVFWLLYMKKIRTI